MRPMNQKEYEAAVERVAAAICAADGLDLYVVEPVYRTRYVRLACAAMAAMPMMGVREEAVVRIDVDAIHSKVRVMQ